MKIRKTVTGDTMTLALEGWLDTLAAPDLEAARSEIGSEIKALVLDMRGLEYMSSAGIRQIVSAYQQMGGKLTLKNVSSEIMEVLRITGLDKRLSIE
ncbi:MAG: STAS domain-containing protein [Lachnospiraceae bacterium]|nr:STAS domain-containing protein [Lachnospiraceae bacterium]